MERDALLKEVKRAVAEVGPGAEISLYGSRARGHSHAESDWDFLILVDGTVSDERIDAIRHRLYEVGWACGQVLCSIVRSREQWSSRPLIDTPFHRNVKLEGIEL
ncbi:MAG TPA: nucleotidyltransferase domain-containing protein [Phycisphaerales bacterium]|nr:nucleotidyltransferase domain-containing protein [Phycisphaerales bacterium]